MRNQKFIVTAIVALGLCFSVGAATGVKISAELKNQAMKVNGTSTSKEVISYNNTTYVPLRQVGDMLGVPVDYKEGVVIIGNDSKEETVAIETTPEVAEEVVKIGEDWILAGTDEDPYFENQKLKAKLYLVEDAVEEETTTKEWLETIVDSEEVTIKSKSVEKVGDVEVGYIHAELEGENQVEANIIDGKTIFTYIMLYDDNSDAATLKDELLKVVEEDYK